MRENKVDKLTFINIFVIYTECTVYMAQCYFSALVYSGANFRQISAFLTTLEVPCMGAAAMRDRGKEIHDAVQ